MDVARQLARARQLVDRLLPPVAHQGDGLQEEEDRAPEREAVARHAARAVEDDRRQRDPVAVRPRRRPVGRLPLRQVVRQPRGQGPVAPRRRRPRPDRLQRRRPPRPLLHVALCRPALRRRQVRLGHRRHRARPRRRRHDRLLRVPVGPRALELQPRRPRPHRQHRVRLSLSPFSLALLRLHRADPLSIVACSIQRCIYKILIAVVVSREYKHDEVNRAWWTGVRLALSPPPPPLDSCACAGTC